MKQTIENRFTNYENCDSVFSRPSVRGIILKDIEKLHLFTVRRKKYYKFPGGGIHRMKIRKKLLFGG